MCPHVIAFWAVTLSIYTENFCEKTQYSGAYFCEIFKDEFGPQSVVRNRRRNIVPVILHESRQIHRSIQVRKQNKFCSGSDVVNQRTDTSCAWDRIRVDTGS